MFLLLSPAAGARYIVLAESTIANQLTIVKSVHCLVAMKLKGFTNTALNLGCVDVTLEKPTRVDFATCAACGFTSKDAFYCECNHTYCTDCIYLLHATDEDQDDRKARCVRCLSDTFVMETSVNERFIANLRCHCPQCNTITRLGELRKHLGKCDNMPIQVNLTAHLSYSEYSGIIEESNLGVSAEYRRGSAYGSCLLNMSKAASLLLGYQSISRNTFSFPLAFQQLIDNPGTIVTNEVDVAGTTFQFAITSSESMAGPRLDIYLQCCSDLQIKRVHSVTVSELYIEGDRPKRVIRSDISLAEKEIMLLGSMLETVYNEKTLIKADFETN